MTTKLLLPTILFIISTIVLSPIPTEAAVLDSTVGKIVIDVEQNGEAWYVYPGNNYRYFLDRPDDAFEIMRELGLGISNEDLNTIPVVGTSWDAPADVINRVRGRIVLQVEKNGEAWYVYPNTGKRYYLGRPSDAFSIMRELGLGITGTDLDQLPSTTDFNAEQAPGNTEYSNYTISTSRGNFAIHVVRLDRSSVKMVTDTGNEADCSGGCGAKSLADYINEHGAIAGIHGSYFCPPDYSTCAGQSYSYLPPVFNTSANVMINNGKLPFHSGPMIVSDTDGGLHYINPTIDFGYSVAEFEERNDVTVEAAIANYPSLVERGNVVVHDGAVDSNQQLAASRGGIGYTDSEILLVIASGASVIDLGYIFEELGADYALNLDGGGSTALHYEGVYIAGPGRLLPNAIVFKAK